MGRFDALTQLEEQPKKPPSSSNVSSPTAKKSPAQQVKKEGAGVKKPEIMKSRKPEMTSPTDNRVEKPEKYSTLMKRSLVKKLKNYATDMDMDDYGVLESALVEYFEKHK